MAQPCGPKHACDRTAGRSPFIQLLHDWPPHGHHTETDRPELTGSTEQKARSQPCEPKRPLPVNPRPTHCDAQTTHDRQALAALGLAGAQRVPGVRSGPAQRAVLPAGGAPLRGVEGVPTVDDPALGHDRAHGMRVDLPELGPLGEQHHHIGPGGGGKNAVAVVQVRVGAAGVLDGRRVDRPVTCAPAWCRVRATSSAGASRMSSELGLNAAPNAVDPDAGEFAAGQLADQVDRAGPAPLVDGVDLAQEGHGLADAELLGAVANARMSLGRQPPPKPRPGLRNRPPIRSS